MRSASRTYVGAVGLRKANDQSDRLDRNLPDVDRRSRTSCFATCDAAASSRSPFGPPGSSRPLRLLYRRSRHRSKNIFPCSVIRIPPASPTSPFAFIWPAALQPKGRAWLHTDPRFQASCNSRPTCLQTLCTKSGRCDPPLPPDDNPQAKRLARGILGGNAIQKSRWSVCN